MTHDDTNTSHTVAIAGVVNLTQDTDNSCGGKLMVLYFRYFRN